MPKGIYKRPEWKCPGCGGVPYLTAAKIRYRVYTCVDCEKRKIKKWKVENKQKIKLYQQRWVINNPDKVSAAHKRRWERRKMFPWHYSKTTEQAHKAHIKVANALVSGKLHKQPCEICKSTAKINAHHPDYSKPLEVQWLCPMHHSAVHRGC